jgi:hypothetical protein
MKNNTATGQGGISGKSKLVVAIAAVLVIMLAIVLVACSSGPKDEGNMNTPTNTPSTETPSSETPSAETPTTVNGVWTDADKHSFTTSSGDFEVTLTVWDTKTPALNQEIAGPIDGLKMGWNSPATGWIGSGFMPFSLNVTNTGTVSNKVKVRTASVILENRTDPEFKETKQTYTVVGDLEQWSKTRAIMDVAPGGKALFGGVSMTEMAIFPDDAVLYIEIVDGYETVSIEIYAHLNSKGEVEVINLNKN